MKRLRFSRKPSEQPVVRRRLSDHDRSDMNEVQTQGQGELPTFSYRRSAGVPSPTHSTSVRATIHELRRRQRSLWSLLLGTMFALMILFLIIYQSIVRVDVSLYGQVGAISQHDKQVFEQAVDSYFSGHPLQRIRVFLDRDMMLRSLHQQGYTEIKEIISIQPAGIGRVAMSLKVRQPLASWTIRGQQYYVDNEGVVFEHNLYRQPGITVRDDSGTDTAGGRPIASSRLLTFIGQVSGYMSAHGVAVLTVILPAETTRQVQFELTNGLKIKMTIDRPVGEQAEDAVRAVHYLAGQGQQPAYVDVRVARVAFYK